MDMVEKNVWFNMYRGWNFGGISDWVIDFDIFIEFECKVSGLVFISRFIRKGVIGGFMCWYDLLCSIFVVDMVDMDRKQ